MYTYFLLELALVMFVTGVAITVEQFKVVLEELELRGHDPSPCGAFAPDPEPRVSLLERGHGNLTVRGSAWIQRVASPGIV